MRIKENNVPKRFRARLYHLFLRQKRNIALSLEKYVLRYLTLLYSCKCKENVNVLYKLAKHLRALFKSLLKQLSHGILSYFGHVQNYLKMKGNVKIVVNSDRKTRKR